VINRIGKIPLNSLLYVRNLDRIEKFLKLGANPNFQDLGKRTSLHIAVSLAD